jgi:hypothetical protein
MSKSPSERKVVGTGAPAQRVGVPSAEKNGTRSVPATDPLAAEIEAELADHLATAAEQLQSQGLPADQAQQKSQEKFGDAAAIVRRCYWIKQGDYVMFRTAVIALLGMFCLALAFSTYSSWRSQRQMADQMTALAERLQALSDQQKAVAIVPAPAEPKPLEITGHAFIGAPDKPAANINLTIIDVKDGSHVRRIATDSDGRFHSGALGGGDYALLAEFEGSERNERPVQRIPRWVQSAPIGVYPGVPVPMQPFDVAQHLAAIAIETSRPLPKTTVDNRYTIETRLMIKVYSSQDRPDPWLASMQPPLDWPVYLQRDQPSDGYGSGSGRGRGFIGKSSPYSRGGREFFDLLSNDDLAKLGESTFGSNASRLPAGKIEVATAVLADIYPVRYQPPEIPKRDSRTPVTAENRAEYEASMAWQNLSISPAPMGLRRDGKVGAMQYRADDDRFDWMTKGLGRIWLTHLGGPAEEAKPRLPYLISSQWLQAKSVIDIASGETARLRVTIPDDLESRVRNLVNSTTDPAEFAKSTLVKGSERYWPNAPKAESLESGDLSTSPFFRQVEVVLNR